MLTSLKQGTYYLVGYVLSTLGALVSVLIFTRIFSVEQYGSLSLVELTLSIALIIGASGMPQSTVRFYWSHFKDQNKEAIIPFLATQFIGVLSLGVIITILLEVATLFVPTRIFPVEVTNLLRLALPCVSFGVVIDIIQSFERVKQNALRYSIIQVIRNYSSIILCLIFVLFIWNNLYGFFTAKVITELILAIILSLLLIKNQKIALDSFSFGIFWESFRYGFPLISIFFGSMILTLGDRYVLQYFLGTTSVGLYSLNYRIAEGACTLLIAPMNLLLHPLYMKTWSREGSAATKKVLEKYADYFLLTSIPVVFALTAVGGVLVSEIATAKFANGSVILPFISSGVMIFGLYHITVAGLFIQKKTGLISVLILFSAFINIILNIFLIPTLGIMGSAIATLISYIICFLISTYLAFKWVSFKFKYFELVKYLSFSFIMYAIMKVCIAIRGGLPGLTFSILIGFLIYLSLILLTKKEIRAIIYSIISLVKSKYKL